MFLICRSTYYFFSVSFLKNTHNSFSQMKGMLHNILHMGLILAICLDFQNPSLLKLQYNGVADKRNTNNFKTTLTQKPLIYLKTQLTPTTFLLQKLYDQPKN